MRFIISMIVSGRCPSVKRVESTIRKVNLSKDYVPSRRIDIAYYQKWNYIYFYSIVIELDLIFSTLCVIESFFYSAIISVAGLFGEHTYSRNIK